MSNNSIESEGREDLDRSSWEGMTEERVDFKIAKFIFNVQKKFLQNENILDFESAAIELVAEMDVEEKNGTIDTLMKMEDVGLRGYMEKVLTHEELREIDKKETRRLVDFLRYAGSTPG